MTEIVWRRPISGSARKPPTKVATTLQEPGQYPHIRHDLASGKSGSGPPISVDGPALLKQQQQRPVHTIGSEKKSGNRESAGRSRHGEPGVGAALKARRTRSRRGPQITANPQSPRPSSHSEPRSGAGPSRHGEPGVGAALKSQRTWSGRGPQGTANPGKAPRIQKGTVNEVQNSRTNPNTHGQPANARPSEPGTAGQTREAGPERHATAGVKSACLRRAGRWRARFGWTMTICLPKP